MDRAWKNSRLRNLNLRVALRATHIHLEVIVMARQWVGLIAVKRSVHMGVFKFTGWGVVQLLASVCYEKSTYIRKMSLLLLQAHQRGET